MIVPGCSSIYLFTIIPPASTVQSPLTYSPSHPSPPPPHSPQRGDKMWHFYIIKPSWKNGEIRNNVTNGQIELNLFDDRLKVNTIHYNTCQVDRKDVW